MNSHFGNAKSELYWKIKVASWIGPNHILPFLSLTHTLSSIKIKHQIETFSQKLLNSERSKSKYY